MIFRTLFSIPIEHKVAHAVFHEFRAYQRTAPVLNLGAFFKLPAWMPRLRKPKTLTSAKKIRTLIQDLTQKRLDEINAGNAPDDLATKIMTTADPVTGEVFSVSEMVDQVAIFFLAGHETSASTFGRAAYLLATHPDWQDRIATEVRGVDLSEFKNLSKLPQTRVVFPEALRLYPPVPMMVRETTKPEVFRNRSVKTGSQVVLSTWHLHRHERLWDNPDGFDPDRWETENGKKCAREAYVPFSSGKRVCAGASFALAEGVLLLAKLIQNFQIEPDPARVPKPIAHLTVRSEDGIWISVSPRN